MSFIDGMTTIGDTARGDDGGLGEGEGEDLDDEDLDGLGDNISFILASNILEGCCDGPLIDEIPLKLLSSSDIIDDGGGLRPFIINDEGGVDLRDGDPVDDLPLLYNRSGVSIFIISAGSRAIFVNSDLLGTRLFSTIKSITEEVAPFCFAISEYLMRLDSIPIPF